MWQRSINAQLREKILSLDAGDPVAMAKREEYLRGRRDAANAA